MRYSATLIVIVAILAVSTLVAADEPATATVTAPVPPPGAVKSASEIVKPTPSAPVSAATSSAQATLSSIQSTPASAPVFKRLTSSIVEKFQQRLDAIRDEQDKAAASSDPSDEIRSSAAKLIARQIARVLERSAETLKRAEDGKLQQKDLDEIKAKLENRPVTSAAATAGSAPASPAAAAALAAKAAAPSGPNAAPASLKDVNKLLPPGVAPPKEPKKRQTGYGAHAQNPKHKLKKRKGKKNRSKESKSPRFTQLPVGVVGDGHNEQLMKTVDTIMNLDNHSQHYKGHVNAEGKLCPTCNKIEYNANSPLSANDEKIMRAQHADIVLKGVPLHAQDTLDRAILTVDDAAESRKKILDKYPPQNALLQFDIHN
jgi:hypothetical protein